MKNMAIELPSPGTELTVLTVRQGSSNGQLTFQKTSLDMIFGVHLWQVGTGRPADR